MLKKLILFILFSLTVLIYYVSYHQGNNLELLSYQIIPNWYVASILGRVIPGLIIFSFLQILIPHKNFFFKPIFILTLITLWAVSIKLNLDSTISSKNLLKTNIQTLLPIYTLILTIALVFKQKQKSKNALITFIIVSTAITYSFISTPLFIEDYKNTSNIRNINSDKTISNHLNKNLIIYASISCPHCYRAILKTYLTVKDKSIKNDIVIKFVEDKKRVEAYFEYINVNFEFEVISKDDFIKENGYRFPSFFLLNNDDKIINYWKSENYNYYTLQNLYQTISLSNK